MMGLVIMRLTLMADDEAADRAADETEGVPPPLSASKWSHMDSILSSSTSIHLLSTFQRVLQ